MGEGGDHGEALERIHPDGPDVWAQVHHAVEREWATTVDDVTRRRTTLAVRGLASPAVRADVGRVLRPRPIPATERLPTGSVCAWSDRPHSSFRSPARSAAKARLAALVAPCGVADEQLAHEPAQREHVGL